MKIKDCIIAATDEAADFGDPGAEQRNPAPTVADDPEDGRMMTGAEVEKVTTLDIKTIDLLADNYRFPAAVRLSDRRRAWRRFEVMRWLADPKGYASF